MIGQANWKSGRSKLPSVMESRGASEFGDPLESGAGVSGAVLGLEALASFASDELPEVCASESFGDTSTETRSASSVSPPSPGWEQSSPGSGCSSLTGLGIECDSPERSDVDFQTTVAAV